MLQDLGSRSPLMTAIVTEICDSLCSLAHASPEDGYECVIMQGSGTFAVESVLSTVVPRRIDKGRLLVLSNGAYGDRLGQIAARIDAEHTVLRWGEREAVDAEAVAAELRAGTAASAPYTHVAMIHHETTSGLLNPLREIGEAVRAHSPETTLIVDSMSGFGAYEVDMRRDNISFLVSSANKNLEGVPGFAFAVCDRGRLMEQGGAARSLCLDLKAQWQALRGNGQFRFTPPTHALVAFRQALVEHAAEGGVSGRRRRYEANAAVVHRGLAALGFVPYLPAELQSCIITSYVCPDDPKFDFHTFYEDLAARGLLIYPGKLTDVECFRVGSIGQLFPEDMQALVDAIREVLLARGVTLPVTPLPHGSLS